MVKLREQKTIKMQLLEIQDTGKRSIQDILRDAYRRHGNMRDAGRDLGITHAAFSQWVWRLGIDLSKLREGKE